jgi:hypothetical protein
MTNASVDCGRLPESYRSGFTRLAETLRAAAGENLLGLAAFGGWLENDPLFNGTPGRSVALLREIDLAMLDRLAGDALKFGRANLSAPLMITPGYIESSCDVFPLEFLEIRQTRAVVYGADGFADVKFDKANVRLQCERELKGELVHLRQGLLAAAGKHARLNEVCRHVATRIVRYLRGVLLLCDVAAPPRISREIVERAGQAMGVKLYTLAGAVSSAAPVDFAAFQRFYGEIDALAQAVDKLKVEV